MYTLCQIRIYLLMAKYTVYGNFQIVKYKYPNVYFEILILCSLQISQLLVTCVSVQCHTKCIC